MATKKGSSKINDEKHKSANHRPKNAFEKTFQYFVGALYAFPSALKGINANDIPSEPWHRRSVHVLPKKMYPNEGVFDFSIIRDKDNTIKAQVIHSWQLVYTLFCKFILPT